MNLIGYRHLIDRFNLDVLMPASSSFLIGRGRRQTVVSISGRIEERYPKRDDPGPAWVDHLRFALKHEGVELGVLAALFRVAPANELAEWIASSPTGRYARIAWFLYEWFEPWRLSLPDLDQGSYVPVFDEERYVALPGKAAARRIRRQRILDNLPGTASWCPTIRRTERIRHFEAMRLDELAATLVRRFPPKLLQRAAGFLYMKETCSSYAIESLEPDRRRTARFVERLREAGRADCFSEEELVRLQNAIVDERYAEHGFRTVQNYVGQTLGPTREVVHFVPPKPGDLRPMMEGWMEGCRRMLDAGAHPVAVATVAGFGFVFLHPFEDGNGRLHRFLIHHALVAGAFVPPGVIFPVSATMLRQMDRYDAALEAWSRPIGEKTDYALDAEGRMTVENDTAAFHRFPDLTAQAEALFGFIEETIRTEMTTELEYLAVFDEAREAVREIVDMPERRLDLLLRYCLQGKGTLSKTKRSQCPELTSDEVDRIEAAVRGAMEKVR